MKIIRKTFLCLLLFLTQLIYAQTTPTCGGVNSPLPSWYTPDWDWLDATPSNWHGNISVLQGSLTMGCPFVSNTNTDDMITVINALDYKPEQGWVLLAKDFGVPGESYAANATPYFMLYNKYKSIIRLFLFYGNPNLNNRASVILKWSSTNGSLFNNSLLTHANSYAWANENYPISNNPEKHVNYMNQVGNSGGWGVTEYLVNFDRENLNSVGNFCHLNFDFKLSNTSTVSINGTFSLSAESATAKNPPPATTNGANPNLLDYVVNGKTVLAKVPKKSELVDGFNKVAEKADEIDEKFCNTFTRDLHNMNNSLQTGKLKQYLIGAAGFAEDLGGVLGTVGSVLELFMSKSNSTVSTSSEAYVQPTISKGSMSLNGTIVTESNPLSISLQLPGSSHKYANGTIRCSNLPVYDCPLGVISLQEAPTIEVRTKTEPSSAGFFSCSVTYGRSTNIGSSNPLPSGVTEYSLGSCSPGIFLYKREKICTASFPAKTLKSYKVTGDIKLALNAQAGVAIESTKAALYFQIKDNNGSPSFDLLQTNLSPTLCVDPISFISNAGDIFNPNTCFAPNTTPFNPTTTFSRTTAFTNYSKNLLNVGHLKLSNLDATDSLHSFQTPFIDISKFKNTSITIEEGCNVYLKLLINLKPTTLSHDQTPIVYVVTYQLPANKFVASNTTTPYIMTCDQRREEDTTLIGPGNTTFSISNTLYTGYAVQTASNSNITANPTFTTDLEAFASIKLKPDFRTRIQTGGLFRAHLSPNTMGCETGANALIVQTYTFDCAGNASNNRPSYSIDKIDEEAQIPKPSTTEELQNLYLKIAPNPNSGRFSLLFSEIVNAGNIKIYNNMGQELYSQNLVSDSNSYDLNLNEHLSPGAYHLIWNNSTFVINQKFIVY